MTARRFVVGALVGALAAPVSAEVLNSSASGFTIKSVVHVAATPARAYDATVAIAHWWGSDHTYSGSAANLSIDARAGGCWCEKLPGGGSVQHMVVVMAQPGKLLRLNGGLGPLQEMAVTGSMTFQFIEKDGGTDITMTYAAGGYTPMGFQALAPLVAGVLAAQLESLKKSIG